MIFELKDYDKEIESMEGKLKILKGTLTTGQTQVTISDASIKTTSVLSFYTSIYGVNPTAVQVAEGSVTLTFDQQQSDMEVGVRVDG